MNHSYINFKFRPKVVVSLLGVLVFSLMVNQHLNQTEMERLQVQEFDLLSVSTQENTSSVDLSERYEAIDKLMADLTQNLNQPNILKEDVLRGWYLAQEDEKKYGTPDNWVFQENGDKSKWVSPNAMEDVEIHLTGELCQQTAGSFRPSCLDSAEDQCEYVGESHCECSKGTLWNEAQGCLLIDENENYVSITEQELEQGYYYGLPNQKKLNTPTSWSWTENGPKSVWHLEDLILNQ